jgi:F-box and leucine-rich repeat protein 14
MNPELLKIIENSATSTEVDLSKIHDFISSDDIRLLAKHCPHLESLILDSCGDKALKYLSLFPKLTKLSIETAWCLSRDGKCVEPICRLSQLTHLAIKSYQDIDSTFLQNISHLHLLTSINFEFSARIYDEDLNIFSKFKYLRFLNLNRSEHLTDNGMTELSSLVNLDGLELAYTPQVTDKGFQLLSNLHQLKYLNLHKTQITDEGMKSLSSLSSLELLNLNQCSQLTEEGLLCLKEFPKLRLVCIEDSSQISEAAIDHLPPSIQVIRSDNLGIWKFWTTTTKEYI